MKTLLVAAQDIKWIEFGLIEDGKLVKEVRQDVPPERYLAALDQTLKEWKLAKGDFAAIAVVAGPGAFTSSRVSAVMANALAFAGNIPVIPIENPKRLPLADLAASLPSTRSAYAVPVYDRPPNITNKAA